MLNHFGSLIPRSSSGKVMMGAHYRTRTASAPVCRESRAILHARSFAMARKPVKML
ncbi:hypothetical protein [Mesorhizobium sp.]|uniref:hypothetical protein n=1 Tax=Mesorhizobium sp. TaxID=1871066 RepID=UPI00257B2B12|nr:hypothetical protein [Mesorhizobium sp.]